MASIAPSLALVCATTATLSPSFTAAEVISSPQDFPAVFNSDEDNTITNTGSVTLAAGSGTVVSVVPDYSSVFTNDGTVTGPGPLALVGNGVQFLGEVQAAAEVINNGLIDLNVNVPANPFVQGLVFDDQVAGRVLNTGAVRANVTVTSSGAAFATGVRFSDLVSATAMVENTGEVAATADATSAVTVTVLGYQFNENVETDITNSGTIRAEAQNADGATARGIQILIGRTLTGDIKNSGTLHASVENADTAFVQGAFVQGLMTGDINNSGEAIAEAEGTTSAEARAYHLTAGQTGDVMNSGDIRARAQSDALATAAGLEINGQLNGDIDNTGTVTAVSEVRTGAGSGMATGIRVDDMQGRFSNTGSISATASGDGSADAFGLYFGNFDGEITDVGEISAISENGDAYAIFLGTGSGTLNLDSRDDVTGLIRVQDHNVNLDAQGGNAVFFFEDAAPGSGTFATTVSDGRSAWFVDGEGGPAPIYAAVDGADIVTSGDIAAYYGSVVGRTAEALRYDQPQQATRGLAFRDPKAAAFGGFRPFAMIDAEFRRFETAPGAETDLTVFNGVAGYSGQTENGVSMAFGLGVFHSDGDANTSDFDTTGVYLDAAFGRQFGAFTVEGGIGYGWLSTDRSRQITGSADADADFDSTLFTAHIGAERAFDVSDKFDLLGFGNVRYTRQSDDAYTETGSIANATVDEATTEVIEARLGVEAEKTLANGGQLIGQLSGVVRRGLGDAEADVTVFSDTQTLSFASTDFTGASVLIGYEQVLFNNMQLEVKAEHEIGDAAQGPSVLAGLKWAF